MKRIISIILFTLFIICCFSSCQKASVKLPKEEQIQAICELTTIEAYYNNLAKSTKSDKVFLVNKEREFWLEYEGYAKIGIDMSDVLMEISENTITISMPHAELQETGINTKSLNKDSCISSDKGWFFPLDITAEDMTKAVADAQETMEKEVLKNKALFLQAESKAKTLIENYINKLGDLSGIEYNIIWKIIDNAPSNTETKE